jgi:hypothetical protein
MTDRELLELASLAADVEYDPDNEHLFHWNPLDDDGDALRLAVKLQIDIKQYGDHVVAWFDGGFIGTGRIPYDGYPCAATRRAIVRAAALIGKTI